MTKIKIKLDSGIVVEKPLINVFSENGNTYVVLDNEMNGSMGLPIILVSKLVSDKLTKIVDANEWQMVKEYLKNIIAGGKLEFVSLKNEIDGQDIYYTQLTLPVSSFDALKNAYVVENSIPKENTDVAQQNVEVSPVLNNEPVNNVDNNINMNMESEAQQNDTVSIMNAQIPPVVDNPVTENTATVDLNSTQISPEMNQNVMPNIPVSPVSDVQPETNISNTVPLSNEPVVNSAPDLSLNINLSSPSQDNQEPPVTNLSLADNSLNTNQNVVPEDIPLNNITLNNSSNEVVNENPIENKIIQENMFEEEKAAFMQACENMFNALVQKFIKEMENKK